MDMSMIQHHFSQNTYSPQEDSSSEDEHNLARLNRYLAILENNRKAASFVPGEALAALDMAEFVRQRLHGHDWDSGLSTGRLALSLVQKIPEAPVH